MIEGLLPFGLSSVNRKWEFLGPLKETVKISWSASAVLHYYVLVELLRYLTEFEQRVYSPEFTLLHISSHISVNTSDPVLLTSIHAGAVTNRASSLLGR